MEYRLCLYEPSFRARILELQHHLWGADLDRNDRYFRWKYEQNPYLPEPVIGLALHGDCLVGMQGVWALPWTDTRSGRPLSALAVGDTVVAPEHQGRGLPSKIHRLLLQEVQKRGYRLMLNTSAGATMRLRYRRAGWREIGDLPSLVLPTSLRSPRPRIRQGPFGRIATAVRRLTGPPDGDARLTDLDERVRAARGKLPPGVTLGDRPRPRVMAAIAHATSPRSRVVERRDAQYFRWRFSNPLCGYRFFFRRGDVPPSIDGYAVVQAHGREHGTGLNVVDWDATSADASRDLLDAVASVSGTQESVTTWSVNLDSTFTDVLAERGFCPPPQPEPPWVLPAFLLRDLTAPADADNAAGDSDDLFELASWDLRMTASDFY